MDSQISYFMHKALEQAQFSYDDDEVPVGCVIVKNAEIIAVGKNDIESRNNSISHAEINAINNAINYLGYKHLLDCEIYITLEPCSMCAGAIILARLPRVYIGAIDKKTGGAKSVFNILETDDLNHRPLVEYGIEQEKCSSLLKNFFKELRKRK